VWLSYQQTDWSEARPEYKRASFPLNHGKCGAIENPGFWNSEHQCWCHSYPLSLLAFLGTNGDVGSEDDLELMKSSKHLA
jgi:hypothetical protein